MGLNAPGPGTGQDEVAALEQAGARAWPSACTVWDGQWCLRLTPGLGSRRINSLTILDPTDDDGRQRRLAAMLAQFRRRDVDPVVRRTPLFPPTVESDLAAAGWTAASETVVMTRPIAEPDSDSRGPGPGPACDRPETAVAATDCETFAAAVARLDPDFESRSKALADLLAAVGPASARLCAFADGDPVASTLAVAERDHLGVLLVNVAVRHRRRGLARDLLADALRFGSRNGARTAWLQVEATNRPALALYRGCGFSERYRYHYLRHPETPS